MRLIGIIFHTLMVQAVIDNRKSLTRRTRGLKEINKHPERYMFDQMIDGVQWGEDLETLKEIKIKCPYGKTGDVLWVRETWNSVHDNETNDFVRYGYKATDTFNNAVWNPSIHMPKVACRIWLRITNIRIERLWKISRKDAIREGIERMPTVHWWKNYTNSPLPGTADPVLSFFTLWQSINGEDSWKGNPWVWVVEFERIEKPIE